MYVWYPGISTDIEELVEDCSQCKKVANEPAKEKYASWAWPNQTHGQDTFRFLWALLRKDVFDNGW